MNISRNIVTSVNWDAGRDGHAIIGIVLHTMVGWTAGAQARFNDPNSQVSVHYGVSLDGSIHQWVDEANTAYQAGNYAVNQKTIGIEHEDGGNANDSTRTQALYDSSSDLIADICKRYNIPCDTNHIFLHKNVIDKSVYPGGTACPDGLDTNKIISMAKAKLGQGDNGMNDNGVKLVWQAAYRGELQPSQADLDFWRGKPWDVCLSNQLATSAAKQIDGWIQAGKNAGSTPTVLKPGTYQVK